MKKSSTSTPPIKAAPLPTREGVSPSCVVLPTGPWLTIRDFLVQRFPGISAEIWAARIQAGEVRDEQGVPVSAERAFQPHLRVHYYRALPAEPRIPFDEVVVFQDDYLVVADKPHFLPVIPSGRYVQETLLVRLKRTLGLDDLAPIHRIDRETAGLVVFTIQPATRGVYQNMFLEKTVHKHYEAIAPWRPELALPLTYRSRLEELLEVRGAFARYGLTPITGRKHQLRAHCAALGMPICHDQIYPVHHAENTDDYTKPLQLLAKSITFPDPISGEPRSFTSPRTL